MNVDLVLSVLGDRGVVEVASAKDVIGDLSTPVDVAAALAVTFSLSEEFLLASFAEIQRVRIVSADVVLSSKVVERIASAELFKRFWVIPFEVANSKLQIATVDPYRPEFAKGLESALGYGVDLVQISYNELLKVVSTLFGAEVQDSFVEANPKKKVEKKGPKLATTASLDSSLPSITELLKIAASKKASDLHLSVGTPPTIRIDGRLVRLDEYPRLSNQTIRELIYSILTDSQRDRFEANKELDAAYGVSGIGRFRVNVLMQRGSIGAVMRSIPDKIAALDTLGLPPIVSSFANIPRGLILVTGPTGSGKSTTLASLIDSINSSRDCHIMTIEDPIEFLHNHKRSVVNQREVGEDTLSFSDALRHVLRQDPDVILVGELRDHETISMALTAAETGHAVFASLHTQDAPQAIDRIIDVFPSYQQSQIRVQLAASLQGVVTQQLLPKISGGRTVAVEVLVVTPAVRNLIREAKIHQVYSSMQAGGAYGMQTMEASLATLVRSKVISPEVAVASSSNPDELKRLVTSMPTVQRRGA